MNFKHKLKTMLRSRRFLVAVGTAVTIAAHDLLGLDEAQTGQLVAIAITWIAADAWRRTGNP